MVKDWLLKCLKCRYTDKRAMFEAKTACPHCGHTHYQHPEDLDRLTREANAVLKT